MGAMIRRFFTFMGPRKADSNIFLRLRFALDMAKVSIRRSLFERLEKTEGLADFS
jgi:hypothetical protein